MATVAPVSPPLSGDIERFRTMSAKMQATANASIKEEIVRIINMPIIKDPTEEEIELVSRYYCPSGTMRLFPEQVKALIQYYDYGSIICPIKVGGGKTLISVLIANEAYSVFGKRKIILLDPPHLINQLRNTELPFYRKHISINVPFYWLAGEDARKRKLIAKSKRVGCYVISYSLLSQKDGSDLIDAIEPDLIIGDEIHNVASANLSARARRFRTAIKKFTPSIVGLSGTITKKSPMDYHFLVTEALKENSFLPRPKMLAEEWAKIIDSCASSIDEFQPNQAPQPGPINIMVKWAKESFPENKKEYVNNLVGFRRVYKKRSDTSPGVVASDSDDGGVSLRISNIKISKEEREQSAGWTKLQELIDDVVLRWISPNGDEIDYIMHIWRWRYELEGFGFYNKYTWPEPEKIALQRKVSLTEATDLLERSKYQHDLHQIYSRDLRKWINKNAKKYLDTPALIGLDMANYGDAHVGNALYKAWIDQKSAMFPEIVEREKSVVRVCDFRAKKIVEWAKEWHKARPEKAAIIWYVNNGVGEWLHELFIAADLPVIYCPRGKKGKENLADRTQGHRFAIASIEAYSDGLNLQYHHDTEFYAQWPRTATTVHQAIGRIRRNGQKEDEVRVFQSICSDFDKVLFASCLNDAAYLHQTSGQHNLLMADYDEKPSLVPFSVMVEWGAEPKATDKNMQELLRDKFSGE